MGNLGGVRTAQAFAPDTRTAAKAFYKAVYQPDLALVLFFCSVRYDLDELAAEMRRLFPGVPVIGCTTCGEIGPEGYSEHSLSGVSFGGPHWSAAAGLLPHLQAFDRARAESAIGGVLSKLSPEPAANRRRFAFMMIDGLSLCEEVVTLALQRALGDIPLFGGSAGDDRRFRKTWVYCDGAFHADAAVLAVFETDHPFKFFKTQHFIADSERLIVTEADAPRRIVKELNGLPAAQEYARAVGVPVEVLSSEVFSAYPVVVRINGMDYVRSILSANPDGSLTFYCAIDNGVILRVAHGVGLIENLQETFDSLTAEIGSPQLVLACDCVLRNLEIVRSGLRKSVGDLFRENCAVGFNTYGEQFLGAHVNQTLTGVAIGRMRGHD